MHREPGLSGTGGPEFSARMGPGPVVCPETFARRRSEFRSLETTQTVSAPAPPSVGVEGASASSGSSLEMQILLLLPMPRGLECLGGGVGESPEKCVLTRSPAQQFSPLADPGIYLDGS